MSAPVSIGDQSRIAYLRQANHQLKSRITTLTQEATTGLRADVPAALNGNMTRLAQVQTRLVALQAYQQNATVADNEFAGQQAAMSALQEMATGLGADLQTAATLSDETSLHLRAAEAREDFSAIVRYINTDVGGRYVFSGAAVQTAPLSDATRILEDARAQIASAATAEDKVAALVAWFDQPPGTGGFLDLHFHGTSAPTTAGVSDATTVSNAVTASDPAFLSVLKGLALASLTADPGLGLEPAEKSLLLRDAGKLVATGNYQMTLVRASVGLKQEQVQQAATRNAAERTALSIARSDMLSADPYETASALTQTEANLQNLYALTARLSRLSLTDYLR